MERINVPRKSLRLTAVILLALLVAGLAVACAPVASPPDAAPAPLEITPTPAEPEEPIDEPVEVPTEEPIEEPIEEPVDEPADGPMSEIERSVQAHVSQELGVDPADVNVVQSEAVEWPDGCLGVAEPDEMCIQVITPGYRVVVEVEGEERVYHTNEDGSLIREATGRDVAGEPGASPILSPAAGEAGEDIAMTIRQAVMQQLHADFDEISVATIEAVEWPDACLGVPNPVELCAQMLTPGYQIVIEANGAEYVYHTDETGRSIRLAQAPQAQTGEPLILWTGHDDMGCHEATIGREGVAFGACYGTQMQGYLAGELRVEDLEHFAATYAPFTAETPSGYVEFRGTGDQTATAAEERMIGEWARLTALEAEAGRSGASWGLALAWYREGGIAGFCDNLAAYSTGHVTAAQCEGESYITIAEARLDGEELAQIFDWLDTYANFEMETTDDATADAMTIRLVFSGAGEIEADSDVQQEIADFAAALFARLSNGLMP